MRIGAPVMLLKNIRTDLVNGLIGEVKAATSKTVTVFFPDLKRKEILTPELFTRY